MKSLPKIALAGPKGGGKTYLMNEVGQQLEFKLQAMKLKKDLPPISTFAFADPIYEAQLDLFDYMSQSKMTARNFNEFLKRNHLDEKIHPVVGMSPRTFRQQYGTEFARARNPEIWVDIMREKLAVAQGKDNSTSGLVLLDVRFPNEVKMCEEELFEVIYVNAMGKPEKNSHDSESHFAECREKSNYIVDCKATANIAVDTIVGKLLTYIEDNFTEAGLIVPKGKLN